MSEVDDAAVQHPSGGLRGCTLAAYAEAKRLPLPFLDARTSRRAARSSAQAVTLCDPLDTLDLFSWRHESIAVAIADP